MARPCIDSVLKNTTPQDCRLIVIDDAADPFVSRELDLYRQRHEDRIAIVRNPLPQGPVPSVNRVLRTSQAPCLVVLGTDTIVTSGWLGRLSARLEDDADVGLVNPVAHVSRFGALSMLPGIDLPRMSQFVLQHCTHSCSTIPVAESFCVAITRKLLERAGILDECFAAIEDAVVDWSLRAQRSGLRTVCTDDVYVYRKGNAVPQVPCGEVQKERSRAILEQRWGDPLPKDDKPAECVAQPAAKLSSLSIGDLTPKTLREHPQLRVDEPLEFLCVLPTLNPYGGVISVVNLMNSLVERGHHCTMVSLSRCDRHPHISYFEPVWVKEWDTIPDVCQGQYDVLMATSWETVPAVVELAKRSQNGHTCYFIQDLEDQFYDEGDDRRRLAVETYKEIDTKFAKTQYLCDAMRDRGFPTHKIRPGMNLDLFYPRPRPDDAPSTVLSMVRYGHHHRGYDLVLETLARVATLRPGTEFTLFGTDDLSEADIPFEHTNMGRVPPDKLPEVYSRADVFLEMSRHHGFGRTGVEAMACGAACVLSDSGGLSEYARHGENALIVPVGDIDGATRDVCRLLDDSALRQCLVAEGLKTVANLAEPRATQDFLNVIYETHPRFMLQDQVDSSP